MSASPPKGTDLEHGIQTPDATNDDVDNLNTVNLPPDFDVKEQDRWLPIANVARIMKNALPDNAKIAKEAKECMQECVSEFISFITSEASEKCHQEKRKTVNGEDILFAMTSLGFENYSEALKIYLSKYRELQNSTTKNVASPVNVADGSAEQDNGVATESGVESFPLVDDSQHMMNGQLDGVDAQLDNVNNQLDDVDGIDDPNVYSIFENQNNATRQY